MTFPVVWAVIVPTVLLCFGAVSGIAQENAPAAGRPALATTKIDGSVELDGKLDEPAWQNADTVGELVQQPPRPGEPTAYKTTVLVLVTADTLYFGFECADPD